MNKASAAGYETPHDSRANLALVGILLLAAALRLVHANAEFWFDEIVTVILYVRPPLHDVLTTYIANNHPLNSVLAHAVAARLGADPWVVRLPAIGFGIAGVWAFWLVAEQVWPRRPALMGTLLFAVSYYDIFYSQNARGYSGFLFFALLTTALLLKLLTADTGRNALSLSVGFAVATALGLYSMPLMAFVVAGQACTLAAFRRWRLVMWLAGGTVLGLVLYAPMLPELISYYRTFPAYTGLPVFSLALARLLAPIAAVLIVGGLVALPLVWRLARRRIDAAALLISPAIFNVVVPLVRGQGVYPRTFIFGLAVGYFVLTEGLDYVDALPSAARLIAGAVVVVSCIQLVPYYRLPKQGFRQALAYIDANRQPADARVGLTLGGKAVRFYDPAVVLIDNADQLRGWISSARGPAWIVSTFPGQMETEDPDLYRWLQRETLEKAAFPGVVGDGTVRVGYWTPSQSR